MAGATLAENSTKPSPILDDPFLWLEEVEGKRALDWVEQRNKESLAELQADERYERFPGMPPNRADVMIAAFTCIIALLDKFNMKETTNRLRNLRYGIAAEMLSQS